MVNKHICQKNKVNSFTVTSILHRQPSELHVESNQATYSPYLYCCQKYCR